MRHNKGLGLVEIILAVAIFGILSTVISSTILSSMKLRRTSQQQLIAQQYASEVLERYRDAWATKLSYEALTAPTLSLSSRPAFVSSGGVRASYGCFDSSGTNLSTSNILEATPTPLNCEVESPDLRRVTVTLVDANEEVLARLTSEIGRPAR